jgi:hypothetical protein
MEEIRNKVKESGLISMDLASFKPEKSKIIGIDIAEQLWERLVLKEKLFREYIDSHDWSIYNKKYVHIYCSVDAILPTWAYMLVSSKLVGIADITIVGSREDLEKKIVSLQIDALPIDEFSDGRIIIKGCADIVEPEFAMSQLIQKLQPIAKSIMYGEPCSTVPIFKRK